MLCKKELIKVTKLKTTRTLYTATTQPEAETLAELHNITYKFISKIVQKKQRTEIVGRQLANLIILIKIKQETARRKKNEEFTSCQMRYKTKKSTEPLVASISNTRLLCSQVPPSVSSSESYSYLGLIFLPASRARACASIARRLANTYSYITVI